MTVRAGALWFAAILGSACTSTPPCERNYSFDDACNRVNAALQGQCGATLDCNLVMIACAPSDGGIPDHTQRACTAEVDACALAVANAADCPTAQTLVLDGGPCPITCYVP